MQTWEVVIWPEHHRGWIPTDSGVVVPFGLNITGVGYLLIQVLLFGGMGGGGRGGNVHLRHRNKTTAPAAVK